MPEIKRNFLQGKMNKDLDERLVPNGQYRHAENIEISTSDDSNVGSIQSILGNKLIDNYPDEASLSTFLPSNPVCVGSIADEKDDSLYWLVAGPSDSTAFVPSSYFDTDPQTGELTPGQSISFKDIIMRTNKDFAIAPSGCEPVFVDKYKYC